MRLPFLTAFALTLCTSAALWTGPSEAYDGPSGVFTVDTGHSIAMFRIKHLDVAYNYGRFNDFSGTLTLDENPEKCEVKITIKTGSVDTNDKQRDGHIMSGEFLGAEDYPEATFTSTKVTIKDKVYTLTGDLELHGKKKEVQFDMELTGFNPETRFGPKLGFEGRLEIDRREFGIETYDNEMLSDKITLIFAVEANGEKE